ANSYTWEPGSLSGFYVNVSPTVTTTYTVTGTAANGCTNAAQYTQSVTICDGFNNNQSSTENISVFPNPSVGNIIISGLSNYKRIEVYNNLGQVIITKEILNDKEELHFFDFAKGIYILKLSGQEASLTKKIVKE
ncbi:MAG: T9SS type A sorting domain-containing protein, partial [Bacteroidia bacterium]